MPQQILPNSTKLYDFATRQNFWGMFMHSVNQELPNPDYVLRKLGKRAEEYKELMYHRRVKACDAKIKATVTMKEWKLVYPEGTPKEVEYLYDKYYAENPINEWIKQMVDTRAYGHKVFVLKWNTVDNVFQLPELIAKPVDYFLFDTANRLRFRSIQSFQGELVDNVNTLLLQWDADYENPYGQAILAMCWWPWFFLKEGERSYARYIQRAGIPHLRGEHNYDDTQQKEINNFKEMLELIGNDGVVVHRKGTIIEALQVAEIRNNELHKQFVEFHLGAISEAWFGESVSQSSDARGSYGGRMAGKEIQDEVADSLCPMIATAFNELNNVIARANFLTLPPIPQYRVHERNYTDPTIVQRDSMVIEKILRPNGMTLSDKYLQRTYGYESDDIEPIGTVVIGNATKTTEQEEEELENQQA